MMVLSSKNNFGKIIVVFYLFSAHAEFPVSLNLPSAVLLSHDIPALKESRIIPSSKDSLQQRHNALVFLPKPPDTSNYFSCCFVFRLNSEQTIEIPLLLSFITNRKGKDIIIDEKLPYIISTDGTEQNIIFKSHGPDIDVHKRIEALYERFINCVKLNHSTENSATINQAMLLGALKERSRDEGGKWRLDVLRAMRATDSEAGAIYVLQHKYVIDNIINELCKQFSKLGKGIHIISIEFHGCTTRDMCPLCFSNMNIIQYLCNDTRPYSTTKFSFLRYLKHILTNPITTTFNKEYKNATIGVQYAIADCPTKIFISSIWPEENNLNFRNMGTEEKDNHLHQFRISSTH